MSVSLNINIPEQYPSSLKRFLEGFRKVFFEYQNIERETLNLRLNDDPKYLMVRNPHASSYLDVIDRELYNFIQKFSITGWHYSRLTDFEVENIFTKGVIPSNMNFFKQRIRQLITEGFLNTENGSKVIASSVLNDERQKEAREGKFYLVSKKMPPDYCGVKPLLKHWGGEVAYFGDQSIKQLLQGIGTGRILECIVPIVAINRIRCVGEAVLANYFDPKKIFDINRTFDFYIHEPLEPKFIKVTSLECSS